MRLKYLIAVPAIFLAAACKGNDAKVDDALNSDLSLAAQPTTPLDSISGVERGYTTGAAVAPATRAPATRTTTRTTSAPVRRTSTARRASSSSSSGTYYPAPAPAPATRVIKNTKRDAAIGAAAGAVIGAATSKNRVKGAVIGGAAGAILGAVIGNNVDKKTVPVDR